MRAGGDDRARYVYFAVAGAMVKIGCSVQPEIRLTQIAEWIPFKVTIAAKMKGGFALEATLHSMFAADWSHLEWFHASPRLMAFIGRVAAGLPVEVARDDASRDMARAAGIRAKKRLSRRVSRAEHAAYGTKMHYALLSYRPHAANQALESYRHAHVSAPSPEAIATLEAYIASLQAPSQAAA